MSNYNDRLTSIYKDLQSILASSGGSCPWTINEDDSITFNQLNIYSDSMYGSVLTDANALWVNTPTLYLGSKGSPIFTLNATTEAATISTYSNTYLFQGNGCCFRIDLTPTPSITSVNGNPMSISSLKLFKSNYLYLYDESYKIGYEYVDGTYDKIHLGPLYYINNGYFYLTPVDLRIASSTIQWDDGLHLGKDGTIYSYGSDDHEWHIDFPSSGYFQIYDTTPTNHVLTSNGTHLAIGNPDGKVIILPSSDGALENSGAFYFTTKGLYGGSSNRWSIETDAEYNTTFNVYSNLNLTSSSGGLRISYGAPRIQFFTDYTIFGYNGLTTIFSGAEYTFQYDIDADNNIFEISFNISPNQSTPTQFLSMNASQLYLYNQEIILSSSSPLVFSGYWYLKLEDSNLTLQDNTNSSTTLKFSPSTNTITFFDGIASFQYLSQVDGIKLFSETVPITIAASGSLNLQSPVQITSSSYSSLIRINYLSDTSILTSVALGSNIFPFTLSYNSTEMKPILNLPDQLKITQGNFEVGMYSGQFIIKDSTQSTYLFHAYQGGNYVSIFGYQFWSSRFVIGASSIVYAMGENTASISFNSNSELVLKGLIEPTADTDAATKNYVDTAIASLKAELQGG